MILHEIHDVGQTQQDLFVFLLLVVKGMNNYNAKKMVCIRIHDMEIPFFLSILLGLTCCFFTNLPTNPRTSKPI